MIAVIERNAAMRDYIVHIPKGDCWRLSMFSANALTTEHAPQVVSLSPRNEVRIIRTSIATAMKLSIMFPGWQIRALSGQYRRRVSRRPALLQIAV